MSISITSQDIKTKRNKELASRCMIAAENNFIGALAIRQSNSDYVQVSVLKVFDASNASAFEQILADRGYTHAEDATVFILKTPRVLKDENLETIGNELQRLGVTSVGGIAGYVDLCEVLAHWMFLVTLDHEDDIIKRCMTAENMRLDKGYTPVKCFLAAISNKSPEIQKISDFLADTASVIHRMEFFQVPIDDLKLDKFITLTSAFLQFFEVPDRTYSAMKKVKAQSDVYATIPTIARDVLDLLEARKDGLIRNVSLTEKQSQYAKMTRRVAAIMYTPTDKEDQEKKKKNRSKNS